MIHNYVGLASGSRDTNCFGDNYPVLGTRAAFFVAFSKKMPYCHINSRDFITEWEYAFVTILSMGNVFGGVLFRRALIKRCSFTKFSVIVNHVSILAVAVMRIFED